MRQSKIVLCGNRKLFCAEGSKSVMSVTAILFVDLQSGQYKVPVPFVYVVNATNLFAGLQ